jgi:RNA polymerase sigma factor (sigma-70 family)
MDKARVPTTADAAAEDLAVLLERMRSADEATRQNAWAAVYQRWYQRVWGRVYYVMRTISWLREPREVAADVTAQVFLQLPEAVARYREVGRPEQWLLRVALRTALRHKEKLTGNWAPRGGTTEKRKDTRGRSYLDIDHATEQISNIMDEVERDEHFELRRRLAKWRDDPTKSRWLELIDLFLEGYSHEEIAERLGITPGTSRTWMWRIRLALAESEDVSGRHMLMLAEEENAVVTHLPAERLLQYADAQLPPAQDDEIQQHVQHCQECAVMVESARIGLAILTLATPAPEGLADRIARAIPNGSKT